MNIKYLIDSYTEKITKVFKNIPRKTKIAIVALLIATTAISAKSCSEKDNKFSKVYLVDINDDLEKELVLKDKDGNIISKKYKNSNQLVGVVKVKKFSKNENYEVIIADQKGNLQKGYIEGKYLEKKILDEETVSFDIFEQISVVAPQSGVWLREEPELNRETKDAKFLKNGVEVIVSSSYMINDGYDWVNAINVENEDLNVGYVAKKYLIDENFNNAKGKRFIVNSPIGLKLRQKPNTSSETMDVLKDGEEVILVPNIPSVNDDKYDWFYVACKKGNKIQFGYAAATYYYEDSVINYLVEKENISKKNKTEEKKSKNNKTVKRFVDTSSAGNVNLKLRSKPGLDGKIIAELEKGSIIFTTKEEIKKCNDSKSIDGHKWVKIFLSNGDVGYVASEYLIADKNTNVEMPKLYSVDFSKEGNVDGYIGMDIKNTTTPDSLKAMLKGNLSVDCYGISSNNIKPAFVYIKLGATGYAYNRNDSDAKFPGTNYAYKDNVISLARICEENNIPYGFYYYSQAISAKDINKEANFISEVLNELGTTSYHVLPLAIDVEHRAGNPSVKTRYCYCAEEKGKSYTTKIINTLMNKVRDENNIDVCFYTDKNTLQAVLNYNELDGQNKDNAWIVDASSTHSNVLATSYPSVVDNVGVRQIALDKFKSVNGERIGYDIDFINKDYYQKLIKKIQENNASAKKNNNENVLVASSNN